MRTIVLGSNDSALVIRDKGGHLEVNAIVADSRDGYAKASDQIVSMLGSLLNSPKELAKIKKWWDGLVAKAQETEAQKAE